FEDRGPQRLLGDFEGLFAELYILRSALGFVGQKKVGIGTLWRNLQRFLRQPAPFALVAGFVRRTEQRLGFVLLFRTHRVKLKREFRELFQLRGRWVFARLRWASDRGSLGRRFSSRLALLLRHDRSLGAAR